MDNGFVKNTNAPDGIHDNVEFNEYRSARWWTARMHREWLLDRIAPFGIAVGMVLAFAIIGTMEACAQW